ncbi:MAG: hypothetical protein WCI55_11810 [Armatimonadota bacterium]
MKFAWWILTGVLLVVRLVALLRFASAANEFGFFLLATDGLALYFGVRNWWDATDKDYNFAGVLVPVGYVVGLLLLPAVGRLSPTASMLCVVSVLINFSALLSLRSRFSIGGTSWVSLCDTGLYRIVRHPQAFARLLLVASCLGFPGSSSIDNVRLLVAVLVSIGTVLIEDKNLMRRSEYQEYATRVKFRVMPGVL